jgi:hypothetical protein
MASGIKITKLLITDLRQSAIHLPEEDNFLSTLFVPVFFSQRARARGERENKKMGKKTGSLSRGLSFIPKRYHPTCFHCQALSLVIALLTSP